MLKERKEVIKHSAAVHIQNSITLLQRRAWNLMLANAYDDLPIEELYSIRVKDLAEALEFDSKNQNYLKAALRALATCGVEWNVLDKDGDPEWGITTLLAEAKINKGVCTYAYSPTMRERLHNPRMYARLSLSMQNKFDSKHALALWELCVDYLDASRSEGQTPWISLATFRKFMGLSEDMYREFKKLNKWVIKDPIKEINRVTDFHVKPEYQRQQRKVVGVKFKIRRVLHIAQQNIKQGVLFPELEDMPLMMKELTNAGLGMHDAWEIWQQGFAYVESDTTSKDIEFDFYVREKIDLLKRRQQQGKVKNVSGFLLEAIKKNYTNAEFAASKKAEDSQKRRQELEPWQREKAQLEKAKQVRIEQQCRHIANDLPEFISEIMDTLLAEQPFLRQFHKSGKGPLENYQSNAFLAGQIDTELVQRFPDRFTAIDQEYDPKITVLDKKIAALSLPNP